MKHTMLHTLAIITFALGVGFAQPPTPTAPPAMEEVPREDVTEGEAPEDGLSERLLEADELLANGAAMQAIPLYQEIVQENYQNIYAHDGLARARFAAGDLPGAATALQIAGNIEPDNFLLHYNQGIVLTMQDRNSEAATAFARAVEAGHEDPKRIADAYEGIGLAWLGQEQYQQAIDAFRDAFDQDPTAGRKLLELRARHADGEDVEVLPSALEMAQEGNDYRFDVLAARIYRALGDFSSSESHLARAEEKASTDAERARVLLEKANVELRFGGDAEALLQEAAELGPDLWEAHYNLGVLAMERYDSQAAIERFENILQDGVSDERVVLALARTYVNAGQYPQALEALAEVEDGDTPLSPEAALTGAFAAYNLGDYVRAEQYLTDLAPQEHGVYALALAGAVKFQAGKPSEAAGFLADAYAARPSDDLQRNVVVAYLAAEDYASAVPHLSELTTAYPNDVVLHEQLGWAQRLLGNTLEAQLAFRRAAALGSTNVP